VTDAVLGFYQQLARGDCVLKRVARRMADFRMGVDDPAGEITQGVRAIDGFRSLTGGSSAYITVHLPSSFLPSFPGPSPP
jgi:hypothetical protein